MDTIKQKTFGITFLTVSKQSDGGWFRLGKHGFGLSWTLKSTPMLFSMRNGYTKYFIIWKWRFHFLKGYKSSNCKKLKLWNTFAQRSSGFTTE